MIIYLHAKEAYLKVSVALFLPFEKSLKCYKKYFLILYVFILEKRLTVNKYEKQMCYEGNESLFFDLMKDCQAFPS